MYTSTRPGVADPRDYPLVLLVGGARFGTTLLRLLLDSHPALGCPAETRLPSLIEHLVAVWATTAGYDAPATKASSLSDEAVAEVARAAVAPMMSYCRDQGKEIYCDKSLDSVYRLAVVRDVFPRTKYVLMFRHLMDTVMSGVEASPWGFAGYGYREFVRRSPENFVAALADYWHTHVSQMLEWERQFPAHCHRVRYEDLVTRPEEVARAIFTFLRVNPDTDVLTRAFAAAPDIAGPGDYKLRYTSRVHDTSVGRGRRVPAEMIPPALLSRINECLRELGYEAVGSGWNAGSSARGAIGSDDAARALAEYMRGLRVDGPARVPGVPAFALIVEGSRELRWVVDVEGRCVVQADGDVARALVGSADDLLSMIRDEVNPGYLLRTGRLRHIEPESHDKTGEELGSEMVGMLRVLRGDRGA